MQTQQEEETEFRNDLDNIETQLATIEALSNNRNNVGAGFHTINVKESIDVLEQKLKTKHNKNSQILNQLDINKVIQSNATRIVLAELNMCITNQQRYIGALNVLTEKLNRFKEVVGNVCVQYGVQHDHNNPNHEAHANYPRLLDLHTSLENEIKTKYKGYKENMEILLYQLRGYNDKLIRKSGNNFFS